MLYLWRAEMMIFDAAATDVSCLRFRWGSERKKYLYVDVGTKLGYVCNAYMYGTYDVALPLVALLDYEPTNSERFQGRGEHGSERHLGAVGIFD